MMTEPTSTVRDLADALPDHGRLAERPAGRRSVVFLDYDGVLTPIVDRPGDGVISDSIWDSVQALAHRCTVYVVSGRNRAVVDESMGANDLVVAGSHDFDIWSPNEDEAQHDAASGFSDLVGATYRLRAEAGSIPGVVVEPKKASVAMHYRPNRLRVMPESFTSSTRRSTVNADDLEIADPGRRLRPHPPPRRWDSCCRVWPADQGRSLSEREPCPTLCSSMTTSTPAPRACGSR